MTFVLELTKSPHSSATNNRGLRRQCGILEDSDFGIVSKANPELFKNYIEELEEKNIENMEFSKFHY